MSDTFDVTASWNTPAAGFYAPGASIIATISGDDVVTTTRTTNQTVGPITLTLLAPDGSTSTITLPTTTAQVSNTVTSDDSVVISAVQDTSANPLTWTIAEDGLSVSATAP